MWWEECVTVNPALQLLTKETWLNEDQEEDASMQPLYQRQIHDLDRDSFHMEMQPGHSSLSLFRWLYVHD